VHERTWRAVRATTQYKLQELSEEDASRCWRVTATVGRVSPFLSYSEETVGELHVFKGGSEAHKAYAKPHTAKHHLDDDRSLRPARGPLLLRRPGLSSEGTEQAHIVPLFETIDDLKALAGIMDLPAGDAGLSQAGRQPRACRR